jgi:hypothetical protein
MIRNLIVAKLITQEFVVGEIVDNELVRPVKLNFNFEKVMKEFQEIIEGTKEEDENDGKGRKYTDLSVESLGAKDEIEAEFAEWNELYGKNGKYVLCNDFDEWTPIEIKNRMEEIQNEDSKGCLYVPLMGKEDRRCYSEKFATMEGPVHIISSLLEEKSIPSLMTLHHLKTQTRTMCNLT